MFEFAPRISIVIPVYNGADYMRHAIDSALAQTYVDIEVIVVNDGSNDGGATEAIAHSYGDRIRYLSKPNGGVATALNVGIAAMTGAYFSWLSHDDAYPPDKIEKQVAFLAGQDDKEIVLYGDYALMDAKGCVFHTVRLPPTPPQSMPLSLYAEQSMHGCTMLVPATAFTRAGVFPEGLRTTQDYDLWVRMAECVPFVHQPEILAYGRQHENQGSRILSSHQEEVRCFFTDHYARFTDTWLEATFGRDGVAAACRRLFPPLARTGLWSLFLNALKRALAAIQRRSGNRLREYAVTLAAALAALGQAGAARLLPPSMWSARQRLRRGLRHIAGTARDLCRVSWRAYPYKILLRLGKRAPLQDHFSRIYRENIFGGEESRSGEGSSMVQTSRLRQDLPDLFRECGIQHLLDAPCGDFNWMRHVDLGSIRYLGIDIVPEIIERDCKAYADAMHGFAHCDLINDPLPQVDLILCRDCLVHLSHADVKRALENFKRSGATYLLTTTFSRQAQNKELRGCWRPLNLEKPPFSLPRPLRLLNEGCTEGNGSYADKCLGLWRLSDL